MVLPSSYLKIPGTFLRLNNVDSNQMVNRLEKITVKKAKK